MLNNILVYIKICILSKDQQINALKSISKLKLNNYNNLLIRLKENSVNKKDLIEYYFTSKGQKNKTS